jgi:hypothetical protein
MPAVTPRRFNEDEDATGDEIAAEQAADDSVSASADTQGYAPQPPQSAYDQPGDTNRTRPLRDIAFSHLPEPAAGSTRFNAEQAAIRHPIPGTSTAEAADLYERANAPMPGYSQTGPGQFAPIPGGPMDPAQQQQQPTGPMAMLQTGPGRHEMVPDTPQNRLISLNHQIATAQLSQSETRRAQDLSNAVQTVQDRVNDGTLSAADGQRLTRQIQQRGEQLWARQGSLPEMVMRQQFLQMQHQAAQQEAIAGENAAQRAARIEANTHTYADGTRILTTPDGKTHIIPPHEPRSQPNHEGQVTPAERAHNTVVANATRAVRAEVTAYQRLAAQATAAGRTPPPPPEWFNTNSDQGPRSPDSAIRAEVARRVAEHHQLAGTTPPTARPAGQGGPPAGNAPPGMQPGRDPTPEGREPARTPLQQGFNTMRVAVQNHPLASLRGDRNTLDRIDELEHLVHQHPSVGNMPLDNPVRQQYDELLHMVRRVVTQGRRPAAAPQRATPVPPQNLSAPEAAQHVSGSGWAGGFSS